MTTASDVIALDRQAMAVWLERPERTIRQYCQVIGYDHAGRALYDAEACADRLASVPTRRREPAVA